MGQKTSSTTHSRDQRFTPEAQSALQTARHLARSQHCQFAGTEHLLLALLDIGTTSRFLEEKCGLPCEKLCRILLSNIVPGGTTRMDATSPSLSRALELALFCGGGRVGKTELLGGLLLSKVKDGIENAACTAITQLGTQCGGLPVEEMLKILWSESDAALSVSSSCQEWIDRVVPARRTFEALGWQWCESESIPASGTSSAQTSESKTSGSNGTNDYSSPVDNTHWAVPGSVLCGHSAGLMKDHELLSLVNDCHVDTFVCLQANYHEYNISDYRRTLASLQSNMTSSRGIRFLHCPIPDFSVLSANSLLSLVAELQRVISEGHVLYVHCYGGHGRTGTVMISLLAAVEGLAEREARNEFCKRHSLRRGCSGGCRHKLPESEEQKVQLQQTNVTMQRQHKIQKNGGGGDGGDSGDNGGGGGGGGVSGKNFVVRTAGNNNEVMYTGSQLLNNKRRCVVTWVGGGHVNGESGVWSMEPVDATNHHLVRIRNCGSGELMYVGSTVLDERRRHVVTWVGGGNVEGNGAIWEFIPCGGGRYKIRNMLHGEYLYIGSKLLNEQRRFVLTWIGGDVEGDAGIFVLEEKK
jgi:hypothetical protein